MNCVLVGAGRLATCLGRALKACGHEVSQVYSRTEESARALADLLGTEAAFGTPDRICHDAELYILAVKDDALPALIPQVATGREDALLVHTSGSMPLSLFAEAGVKRGGVLYPMQTFSKGKEVDFSNLPIFVEAMHEADERLLKTLAATLSRRVYVLPSEARRRLHLSAVFACNFANHCYALAARELEKCGLPFDVLLPLIDETAGKVHTLSPHRAQTGPAVRFDEAVMQKHLALLRDAPLAAQIYELMSRSIHAEAGRAEADTEPCKNQLL